MKDVMLWLGAGCLGKIDEFTNVAELLLIEKPILYLEVIF